MMKTTKTISKRRLVLHAVRVHCVPLSPIKIFHTMAVALEDGDDLDIEAIPSSGPNYSYRVSLRLDANVAVYAKLAKDKAASRRIENEFRITHDLLSGLPEALIVKPFFCDTLENGLTLLVTEYKPAREPWAYQFLEGDVDRQAVCDLATTIAQLHSAKGYGQNFINSKVVSSDEFIMLESKERLLTKLDDAQDHQDQTSPMGKMLQDVGREACLKIMDSAVKNFKSRECLIHNDLNVYNILTDKRSFLGYRQRDGEGRGACICDFELATVGPIGRDVGTLFGWPIAFCLWHANQGREEAAAEILAAIEYFWKQYSSALREVDGRDETSLTEVLRNVLGWSGWFLCIGICLNGEGEDSFDFLHCDGGRLMEAICNVGMRLMNWGFGGYEPDLSLEELCSSLVRTVQNEEDRLLGIDCYVPRHHRNSLFLNRRRKSCSSDTGQSSETLRRDSGIL